MKDIQAHAESALGRPTRLNARHIGLITCGLVAAYFLSSVAYALIKFNDFAAAEPQFVRYVVVPALIGLGMLAVGIFAKPRWAEQVGICGVSLLCALFLFEGLLTFHQLPVLFGNLGQMDKEQKAVFQGEGDVVRGFTLRQLNDLTKVQNLPDVMLSGFPASTVLLCSPPGQIITYLADRYGFNNPNSAYDAPIDVALIGDSFVEGFCLPPGQELTSQLRSRGLNTVGLGIRGNGPLFELATLGRYGPLLRPKHVVWSFFEGNDWENLEAELNAPYLRPSLQKEAEYGNSTSADGTRGKARPLMKDISNKPVTTAELLARTAVLRNFAALQMTSTSLGLLYPKVSSAIPEFRLAMQRAKELTESWGGQFSLLYVPRVDRFLGLVPSDAGFDQLRDIVLAEVKAEGIDVIDLREAFRDYPDAADLYAPDAHFSRTGATAAARVIACRLTGETCSLSVGLQEQKSPPT